MITQELDDLVGNQIVKDSIINNSEIKFLLDQKKYQNKFEVVQNLLGLSDKERQLVLSVNQDLQPNRRYKEVFISWAGMESKVYGTEVSREEYAAYTTEQREKVRVMDYAQRLGSMEHGIKAFVQAQRK